MEKLLDKMGMWAVLALVAVVVIAYAFWGAAVLRGQHDGGTLGKAQSAALSIQ